MKKPGKLYYVEYAVTSIVVAKNEEDARKTAQGDWRMKGEAASALEVEHVRRARALELDFEDCLPYYSENVEKPEKDMTVREILENDPEYQKSVDAMKALRRRVIE